MTKDRASSAARDIFNTAEGLSRNVDYFTNGLSKSDRFKWMQSIHAAAGFAGALIDLILPRGDPLLEAFNELRSFMEQKFEKLTRVIDAGFQEVERRMDFHHYRNDILLRISTYPNMLSSYSSHPTIDYDVNAYTALEKSILNQVVTLALKKGRDELKQYWPNSARRIAEKGLNGGGENEDAAKRIHQELNAKYPETFLVAVYDGVSGGDEHYMYYNTDRVTYQYRYKTEQGHLKNYVVFRSVCKARTPEHRDFVRNTINMNMDSLNNQFQIASGLAEKLNKLLGYDYMVLVVKHGSHLRLHSHVCTEEDGNMNGYRGKLTYVIGLP
ncbi:hypothetical protein Ddc_15570 [Ditylenchus destructor]|nr:hypothetical protein Ddc_15570 [Ditylenchus destructor]